MPITITALATEQNSYGNPFVGAIEHRDVVKVDISALTTAEVDSLGYIKPGLPLLKTGLPVTTGVTYGVTIEAIKIAADNATATLAAATDCFVALGTHGVVNRDIMEDNLGRVLTAAEIAGFADDGALKLTRT
jgi:hypothetical protein